MTDNGAVDPVDLDQTLHFTVPGRDVRGRAVRLGPVLDRIVSAHSYPLVIRHLLAEALVLTALMGSLLKDEDGQLTVQAQTEGGVVDLLVCDYRGGELRGYLRHDPDRLAALGASPSLPALFGPGYLAMTFDLAATGQRYQGIVPLEGHSLAAACEHYFAQSEQVPTLIRVAVRSDRESNVAGGILLQHMPEGEEGRERLHVQMDHPDWAHVAAMAGSVSNVELADRALPLEDLLWRLFNVHDEVTIRPGAMLSRGCRCSIEHYRGVLSKFPEAERAAMRDENGAIVVDCAFCSQLFRIEA